MHFQRPAPLHHMEWSRQITGRNTFCGSLSLISNYVSFSSLHVLLSSFSILFTDAIRTKITKTSGSPVSTEIVLTASNPPITISPMDRRQNNTAQRKP